MYTDNRSSMYTHVVGAEPLEGQAEESGSGMRESFGLPLHFLQTQIEKHILQIKKSHLIYTCVMS